MKMKAMLLLSVIACAVVISAGASEGEREVFGKWRIGVGAAFNSGVRANLCTRNMPVPSPSTLVGGRSRADAQQALENGEYDGGGFIKPDSDNDGIYTTNWQFPEGDRLDDGSFLLHNAYSECTLGEIVQAGGESDQDEMQYGVSLEFSRELWIHDENEEHRWGVDFAAAFSYFFQRDVYGAGGTLSRTDTRRDGDFQTPVNDPDAMFFYDNNLDSPRGGMYGYGAYDVMAGGPALKLSNIGSTTEAFTETTETVTRRFSASGDYRELEMLFMFRPWYEIKDWWRVFAQVGVGVSWGRFDSSFHSDGISAKEKSTQWDVYGVAGLGTVFRYDDWTLGIDFLGRFLRDDFEVDGKYVDGEIRRADWGFRVMLGYEF